MSMMPFYPNDRLFRRMFNDFYREFENLERGITPYWKDLSLADAHSFGNALGEVVNDKDKFSVSVDVRAFHPSEVKVDVQGNELTITGQHEERPDGHSRISRSFVRKYIVPEDVNLDGIRSTLSNEGKLCIEGPKKALQGPQSRNIPIEHHK